MKKHTREQFEAFMACLVETNAKLSYFTDFAKCQESLERIEMKLNALNYLLGKENLEEAVKLLWNENPGVFSAMEILIAVRPKDDKKVLVDDFKTISISSYLKSPDKIMDFLRQTGLEKVLVSKQVKNLVDYVFGVEVGLDSNARKNRSGKLMENMVAAYFDRNQISYHREVKCVQFPIVHKALGKDIKRFDFTIEGADKTYLIETNFYSGSGSKPNEVARSYIEIAAKINACPGFEFVWITDGIGWRSAAGNLEEAFYAIPSIYNLSTLPNFIESLNK